MPRRTGGSAAGALGAMEARDKAQIQKRERTGEEISIPTIEVLPDSEFPEPPGKRMIPWMDQNAGGTDIIIGTHDDKGYFQGLILTEVQMQSLLRYVAMVGTYMPTRVAPPQFFGLAASLRDGVAAVVVTRGAYGREMDEGMGPERNAARPAIWDAVKEARIMNPMLKIVCVDAPSDITGGQLSKVLAWPLSEQQELAFYQGVWYKPDIFEDKDRFKAWEDFTKKGKVLFHTRVYATTRNPDSVKTQKLFNPKRFAWRDLYEPIFFKSWSQVHTDETYVKNGDPNIERNFEGPTIHNQERGPALGDN